MSTQGIAFTPVRTRPILRDLLRRVRPSIVPLPRHRRRRRMFRADRPSTPVDLHLTAADLHTWERG